MTGTLVDFLNMTASGLAISVASWAAYQVAKVPSMEEKIDHCVQRLDSLHDFLIGKGPHQG